MNTNGNKKFLSEEDIDQIVVEQADDDEAWEEPIAIRRQSTTLSIPADLASRAAFLARLHRVDDLQMWITRIIRERVEVEEAAFVAVKRELLARKAA